MTVDQYLQWESQQDYLLIDSDNISVERYSRGEGRMWLYYPYRVGDEIALASLGFDCPIEQLYDGVVFETDAP